MAILTAIISTLIVLTSLFMICLVLIQRGKGGGLAGAFGGVGGSSAFGTKSGDVFTKVTMVVASIWIVLAMIQVVLYNQGGQSAWGNDSTSATSKEVTPRSNKSKTTATGAKSVAPPVTAPPASPAPVSVPALPSTPSTSK